MHLKLSAFFVGAVIILSLCVLLSPTVSAVSSAAVSAIRVPVWAFNGAYANYTLTETVANQTADSGWETFTINQVNATAGTFNMTTSFFDQAQASRGQGVRTQNGVFALNQSFVFPALNSSQLDMLNQGKLPGIGQNASVVTATLVSVKAGTFPADQVTSSDFLSLIWIDSYSGMVLRSGVVFSRSSGPNGTQISQIVTELSSTNVPMSSTLPFNMAWLAVTSLAAAFAVIGLALAIVMRRGAKKTRERLGDATEKSGPSSLN